MPPPFRIFANLPVTSGLIASTRVVPRARQIGLRSLRMSSATSSGVTASVRFPISAVPRNWAEGNYIRTAGALIIGDEILNGKTLDSNSHFFAKYCFEHGVDLKRIEVIADSEDEIIEASRRMVRDYDFVITSGGIGPTHDDITYASLAKSFNQSLVHHQETLKRMAALSRIRKLASQQNAEQREAQQRMALFPEKADVIFVEEDIWVPVVRLEGKLCILPGIPSLFQRMLTGLTPFLPLPPKSERPLRIQVFTERLESMIAPYLTSLQARLKSSGIQVGSYPLLGRGVTVSLIGRDLRNGDGDQGQDRLWLADVAREVEAEIGGRVVSDEEVAQKKQEARTDNVQQPPPDNARSGKL